jgi:hypothetical protein
MTEKEFIYWLKGIMDSTQFMPTKKTWDTIQDKLKEVNEDEQICGKQQPYIIINPTVTPQTPNPNEPPQILC